MTDPRYDRYKDALRRGHVAALRGDLEVALGAYAEAADIAPDRPLPHAGRAGVLLRLERPDDALAAYDDALARAPRDEASLLGRAMTLATLGRRVDAARALDAAAEVQLGAGRLTDACETACRALELAESRARRAFVRELVGRLRDAPDDERAAAAIGRAEAVLDPSAPPQRAVPMSAPPAREDAHGQAEPAAEPPAAPPEPEVPPEPEAPPDGVALVTAAEDRLDAGDTAGARQAFVAAAAAHRMAGHVDAALDAAYAALGIAPSDTELHLLLARLYLDRGWHSPATDKLRLLDRLTDLSGDRDGRRAVRSFVAQLANEPDPPGAATADA